MVHVNQQKHRTQPHSLPIAFPIQLASNAQVSWTPYTNTHDFHANEATKTYNAMIQAQAVQWRNHHAQLQAVQQAVDHHAAAISGNVPNTNPSKSSRGRSRERGGDRSASSELGISSMEQRRRAQSKSPARQRNPGINGSINVRKHIDLEEYERGHGRTVNGVEPQSLLSGLRIGRRIRVLGDAVRQAMSGTRKSTETSNSEIGVTATPLGTPHLQLKSNLKKQSIALQQQNVANTSDPKASSNIPLQSASSLPSTNNVDWPYENSNNSIDAVKPVSNSGNTRLECGVTNSKSVGNTYSSSVTSPKTDSLQNQNNNGCHIGNNKEDKKVHFNKFATVQMME